MASKKKQNKQNLNKWLWLAAGALLIFAVAQVAYPYLEMQMKAVSLDKVCAEEGRNAIVVKTLSRIYPDGKIVFAYKNTEGELGPRWQILIRTRYNVTKGNTVICSQYMLPSECRAMAGTEREDCFHNVTFLLYDEQMCTDFQKENQYCYGQYAYWNNDSTACKNISNESPRDECYALAAGFGPESWNSTICEKLAEADAKAGCLKFIGRFKS